VRHVSPVVMAGLVPAIHVFLAGETKDVDARHKARHDEIKIGALVEWAKRSVPTIHD
jgi:hypothetical protein